MPRRSISATNRRFGDGAGSLVDRRRLSVQWFSGTILTGLCGAALMGGAVFASLDGETNFASAPEQVESALRGAISSIGDRLSGLHKTDRLPALSEPSRRARRYCACRSPSRVRNREIVRVRSYERVTGNLSLTVSDLSANIPPFNPQKLLTDSVAGDDQTPAAEPDAEVSFVTCDLVPPARSAKHRRPRCRRRCATSIRCCRRSSRRRCCRSTTCSRRSATSPPRSEWERASLPTRLDAEPEAGLRARTRSATTISASHRASFPRTSRCCRRRRSRSMAAAIGASARSSSKRARRSARSCASSAPHRTRSRASSAVIGPAALEGGIKEGEKLRVLMAPAGLGHMEPLRVIIAGEAGSRRRSRCPISANTCRSIFATSIPRSPMAARTSRPE